MAHAIAINYRLCLDGCSHLVKEVIWWFRVLKYSLHSFRKCSYYLPAGSTLALPSYHMNAPALSLSFLALRVIPMPVPRQVLCSREGGAEAGREWLRDWLGARPTLYQTTLPFLPMTASAKTLSLVGSGQQMLLLCEMTQLRKSHRWW